MLSHLGLGGDGDEITAIEDVEREFGVGIDTGNAACWRTTGDVFDALLPSLPDYVAKQPSTWPRFCHALSQVSGDDPRQIERQTILIGRPRGLTPALKSLFGG